MGRKRRFRQRKAETINFGHFFRLLTSQPYFIWNYLSLQEVNRLKLRGKGDAEEEVDSFWDLDLIAFNAPEWYNLSLPYAPLRNNSLNLLEEAALAYLKELAIQQGKRVRLIRRKATTKERFKETAALLSDRDVDLIIHPLFIYRGAATNLFAYDKSEQALIIFLPSFSTKRNNLAALYWNLSILESVTGFEVRRSYFLMLRHSLNLRRGEIDFYLNPYCVTTLSPSYIPPALREKWRFRCHKWGGYLEEVEARKNGLSQANGKRGGGRSALEIVRDWSQPRLLEQPSFEEIIEARIKASLGAKKGEANPDQRLLSAKLREGLVANKQLRHYYQSYGQDGYTNTSYSFRDIDTYIKLIKRARRLKNPQPLPSLEDRFFKVGHNLELVLALFGESYCHYSGYFLPTKTKINLIEVEGLLNHLERSRTTNSTFNSIVYKLCQERTNSVYFNSAEIARLIERFSRAKRVAWFDFEAVSSYFALVDGALPFQQLVSQLTVVVTSGPRHTEGGEVRGVTFDPKLYKIDYCKQLIDTLYELDASYYVVFNRGYEESRMREAVDLIWRSSDIKVGIDYRERFLHINERIVDLQELFKPSKIGGESSWKMPPVFIPALAGKFSIKLIERFLTRFRPEIVNRHIRPYASLEVRDGMMAMELAIKRVIGRVGNKAWAEAAKQLAIYCENDVRTMIMVYDFLNFLLLSSRQIKIAEGVWEELSL